MTATVFGYGPIPADLVIVGQNPGATEARVGRPFCGASGREQAAYLRRAGVDVSTAFLTNVSKTYNPNDAPPTAAQIDDWTLLTEAEIIAAQPSVIATVGAYATKFFLGVDADFSACQGLPHEAGAFDPSIAYRACGAVIVPVLHPAAAMRDDKGDKRALCLRDYMAVGDTLRKVLAGETITYRRDEYEGREKYRDVAGWEVAAWCKVEAPREFALDTEGTPDDPFSIQGCSQPGTGWMLRVDQPDFAVGVAALQELVDSGALVITHDASTPTACMYDTVMCRAMGLELSRAKSFNTMLALYEMRLEPWGLKPAAWRWLRAKQTDYMALVDGIARERQLAYLDRIADYNPSAADTPANEESDDLAFIRLLGTKLTTTQRSVLYALADAEKWEDDQGDHIACQGKECYIGTERISKRTLNALVRACAVSLIDGELGGYEVWGLNETGRKLAQPKLTTWPKLDPTLEQCNDGTVKVVTVERPSTTAKRLARDVRSGKLNKQGEPVSIEKRWRAVKPAARQQVEAVFGKLPRATLRDVLLDEAVWYGCRDADLTLRLKQRLVPELERLDLTRTMSISGAVLPIYESAQRTGLPASRRRFVDLHNHLSEAAAAVQARIQHEYFDDVPFNPKSPKHVDALMRKRGLVGAKRTKTGAVSTGKKSIEHFRFKTLPDGTPNTLYDPAMALVTDWREHKHVDSMYGLPVLRRVGYEGDDAIVIHPVWKPMGTVTGRPAVDRPPLLAFPKHEKPSGINYGQVLRDCFVCPPGTVLCEVDLSQVELRMFAHESGDPTMCASFINGHNDPDGEYDLHTSTAAKMFGVPYRQATKLQRTLAKNINFGTLYGLRAYGLLDQMRTRGLTGFTERECDKWLTGWRTIYRRGAEYIREVERSIEELLYARDWSGHCRFLAGAMSPDEKTAAEAKRQGVNTIIQGGAGAYMKCAMAWMWPQVLQWQDEGEFVQLALMVYDSLVFWCSEGMADRVEALAVEGLTGHGGIELRVPVEVGTSRATSWGQL